jgi:hypothetical protein
MTLHLLKVSSFHSLDLEQKEKNNYFIKNGTLTPRHLEDATFETPMKRLIMDKNPSLKDSQVKKIKYGSPLAWFAFGMIMLYGTLASIKYSTLVPKNNFWVKTIDCKEGDEHCSFQDVTCGKRDVEHKCLDSLQEFKFYNHFVERAGIEISRIDSCEASLSNRSFSLDE